MSRIFNRENLIARPVQTVRQWIDDAVEAPDAFAWIIFAAVAANTLAYVVVYSNPIIQSDGWYFLDAFVRKALDGTLHLGDFFVQRGGVDHAQPLRKLILLIDLRYFDLDLRYEALAGWFGAMVSLVLLRRIVLWHQDPERPFRGTHVWIWAGLCIALVSLNSRIIWTWPLLAANYTSYVLLFAVLLSLWRWVALGRFILLIMSALALNIAADDTAILANIACLLALGVTAWQNPAWRKRVLIGSGMLLGCLIVVRIGYVLLFTPPEVPHIALGEKLGNLWADFFNGGWWQWALVPLAASASSIVSLKYYAAGHVQVLQIALGLGLLLAHIWFWWRVLWKRPPMTAAAFAAIALMLLFYAFLAGIIYGRVSIHGSDYLRQPRYVLIYSFNVVALLLMCASCTWRNSTVPSIARKALTALIALFICWQIPLSHLAWTTGPFVKRYQQNMAWQIGELARHPGRVPDHCSSKLTVCRYPPDKRTQLIQLLQSHQLNIFSPRVQRATQLNPNTPPR